MRNDCKDDIEYRARLFKDKAIFPFIKEELEVLVQVILGDRRTLTITHCNDINRSDNEVQKFDQYPSCKANLKQWCPAKAKTYEGCIKELGYVFYGDSEVEIYCEVIKHFIGAKTITPLSY